MPVFIYINEKYDKFLCNSNLKSSRLYLSEYNSNLKIICAVLTTQKTTLLLALLLKYIPSFMNRANLPSRVCSNMYH